VIKALNLHYIIVW